MIAYTENGNNESAYTMKLNNNKYIVDMNYKIMNDGTVTCGGYYSNENNGGYSSIFIYSFNPINGTYGADGYIAFNVDELPEFMSVR
jgi:hypothetical protein